MVGMDFYSAYHQGFVRVAACTQHTTLADPVANAESVLAVARDCDADSVAVAVFPELTLSGYSIEDILQQDALLEAVHEALLEVVAGSVDLMPVLVVGAPLRHGHRIYNTAVVIHRGRVLGVVPKSYLPTYREFYERRQMAAGDDMRSVLRIGDVDAPFGPDLLFAASDIPGLVLHVEICEDMFVPIPPSAEAALAGATVLANLSGSPITIGRAEDRELLARSASSRCLAAYIYAAAGEGESTTDLAWDGQTMVWENGVCLADLGAVPRRCATVGRRRRPRTAAFGTPEDGHLRRQSRPPRHHRRGVSPRRVPARPADRRHRIAAQGRAIPVRAGGYLTAGTGLLRGLQHPGVRARAAAARTRLAEGGHRCLRRPRLDACADRRRPRDGPAEAVPAATSWRSPSPGSRRGNAPRATPFGSVRRSG